MVSSSDHRIPLKAGDVIWLKAGAEVKAKAKSRICAGQGRQVVRAGKGRAWVSTGPGNDVIRLNESSNRNQVTAGAGNDQLYGAKGHDTLIGGPGADKIWGNGGNDRITDISGIGNRLFGEEGSDQIHSLGSAVSELHGGNGSDFLYSNGGVTPAGEMEKLFGEKGNDRLHGDEPNSRGPAFFDGGEGDDWVYGTPHNDIAIFNSGIKKIMMGEGDDLMVASGRGKTSIDGGPGTDTISYEALMPRRDPRQNMNGIRVRLAAGISQGYSTYTLAGIENVIGSAFRDQISGVPGQANVIRGGLSDDWLFGDDTFDQHEEPFTPDWDPKGDPTDADVADGGLGGAMCMGFRVTQRCGDQSPANPGEEQVVVSIEAGGVLTVFGSILDDSLSVVYNKTQGRYEVRGGTRAVPAGLCTSTQPDGEMISCPADVNRLTGLLVYGGKGDDRIQLDPSIPSILTTTLDGGTGANFIRGGPSKDFISTDRGVAFENGQPYLEDSAGSELHGGGNLDVIYANDAVKVDGGSGPDTLRVLDPCLGANLNGGDDPDSVVFAGAKRGVKANLAEGFAGWRDSSCEARTAIAGDIEKLEGTSSDDWLILGKRLPGQQGKSTLLGREGVNVLDGKNGDRNTITTGPEKHENTVIADPEDKVVWGWGLAAF